MTQFNSHQLSASDELIVNNYLTKYASDNTMEFTLTNQTVIDSYIEEAYKFNDIFKGQATIKAFIDLLENLDTRMTKPTPEVSEEA